MGAADDLLARWTQSERRIYPLATTRPEAYEQAVRLVRAVADDLADTSSPDELAARWPQVDQLVQAVADQSGLAVGSLPVEDIGGAAFALRLGELRALEEEADRVARIAAARADGRAWTLLHEQGALDRGLVDPYQAVDLHIETGLAVISSVELDPTTGREHYVISVVRLDPDTGATVDLAPGILEDGEHPTVEEYRAALEEVRAQVEGS